MYNDENTSYPGRPPKKFPDKSLHGRVRSAYIPYENLSRAQKFYVNVFDWDMFALPPNVLGRVPDKETPDVCCATGRCSCRLYADNVGIENRKRSQTVPYDGSKHGCSVGGNIKER